MNNQQIMENYLLVLKSTVEVYVHGTLESSNPDIRKIMKAGLDDTLSSQEKTYTEMTNYGWYKIKNIKKENIRQVLKEIINN